MKPFNGVKACLAMATRLGRWRYVVLGLAVLGIVAFMSMAAAPERAESWVAVSSQRLEHEIGLVGKIEPIETLIINAPFEGVALDNELSLGLQVEQGQALLSLDTALIEVQLRDALASKLRAQQTVATYNAWSTGSEVMRARQALRIAELSMQGLERELAQIETLYQKGIVPRNERDTLKEQRNLQSLELSAAKAELESVLVAGKGEAKTIAEMEYRNASIAHEQLNRLLEYKTLHAPWPGVVLSLGAAPQTGAGLATIQKGLLFSKGQEVMKLASLQGLKVVALVSESDINTFSLDQSVVISGDGFAGQLLSGRVSAISRLAIEDDDPSAPARFPLTITVNDAGRDELKNVMPGMSAHMTIVTYRNENSFIIPHGAVEQVGKALFVEHRERPDAPSVRREVTIGRSTAEGVEVFGVDSGFVRVR